MTLIETGARVFVDGSFRKAAQGGWAATPAAPFPGVKSSGIGHELGSEGLAAYQSCKSIYHAGPA